MKKRFLLLILAVLTVTILGIRQWQTRSLRADFCRSFLSAKTVRVFEQKSDFPSKPQPQLRPIASFSGAQFQEFAEKIELKPCFPADGCTGHSNVLVFQATNKKGQIVAGFVLEKQVECGNRISNPRYPKEWEQRFEDFCLTPASHAAIFELASRKFGWKNRLP